MIDVRDILSTVGDVQYRGGYFEYCGRCTMGKYHEYRGGTWYHGEIS